MAAAEGTIPPAQGVIRSSIRQAFSQAYARNGWDGVYAELLKRHGYTRSFGGMYHAAARIGPGWGKKRKSPPRTPWHNGKVERITATTRGYFYGWEKFASVREFNEKLKAHLSWSNNKAMRTLGWKSPLERLAASLGSYH